MDGFKDKGERVKFWRRIQTEMKFRGWTFSDLARELRVSPPQVRQWSRGVGFAAPPIQRSIAAGLGVRPEYLRGGPRNRARGWENLKFSSSPRGGPAEPSAALQEFVRAHLGGLLEDGVRCFRAPPLPQGVQGGSEFWCGVGRRLRRRWCGTAFNTGPIEIATALVPRRIFVLRVTTDAAMPGAVDAWGGHFGSLAFIAINSRLDPATPSGRFRIASELPTVLYRSGPNSKRLPKAESTAFARWFLLPRDVVGQYVQRHRAPSYIAAAVHGVADEFGVPKHDVWAAVRDVWSHRGRLLEDARSADFPDGKNCQQPPALTAALVRRAALERAIGRKGRAELVERVLSGQPESWSRFREVLLDRVQPAPG